MTAPSNRSGQTIVDVANGGRIVAPTKPTPRAPRPAMTQGLAGSPEQLARYLVESEGRTEEIARIAMGNVFAHGVLIRNIAMIGGTPNLIEHRLGRDVSGWLLTRYRGNAGDYPALPIELPLPTGRPSSQWIYFESERNCTLDLFVF